MPALTTPQRTSFDDIPYTANGYVYIQQPDIVYEAPLDSATTLAGGISVIQADHANAVTNELSFGTDAWQHAEYTIELENASGDVVGVQRVRYPIEIGYSAANGEFPVGRTSDSSQYGELDVTNATTVKVYAERRLWSKIPFIDKDGTQYKDNNPYNATIGSVPDGVPNAGGHQLIITPDGSDIQVTLDAFGDVPTFDPLDLTTDPSIEWWVPDAAFINGGDGVTPTATTDTITLDLPVGEHWIRLQAGSYQFQQSWILIVVAEPSDCIPVDIANESIRPDGVQWSFIVDYDQLPTGVRAGTQVLYVQQEDFDTATLGYSTRFIGYLKNEQWRLESPELQYNEIRIECIDVGSRLKEMYLFPQSVRRANGNTWYEISECNFDTAFVYFLQWHTNVLELYDFYPSGLGETYALPEYNTEGQLISDQLNNYADSIGYSFTVNTKAQIRAIGNPNILPTSAQAADFSLSTSRTTTEVTTLTTADYTDYQIDYNQPPISYWVIGDGIATGLSADEIIPLRSKAPSLTPGQGYSETTTSTQLVVNQDELNVRTGNRYAFDNRPYRQLSFELIKTKHIFEPADMEWVVVELPNEPRTKYNISNTQRYRIAEMINTYDHQFGTKDTAITCVPETSGTVAETELIPEANDDIFNFGDLGQIETIVPTETETTNELEAGIEGVPANMLVATEEGSILVSTDFNTSSPTWSEYALGNGIGVNNQVKWVYDPRAFESGQVDGWMIGEDGIFYVTNAQNSGTYTVTEQIQISGGFNRFDFDVDRTFNPGLVLSAVGRNSFGRFVLYYSTDGGGSWDAFNASFYQLESGLFTTVTTTGRSGVGVVVSTQTPNKIVMRVPSPANTSTIREFNDFTLPPPTIGGTGVEGLPTWDWDDDGSDTIQQFSAVTAGYGLRLVNDIAGYSGAENNTGLDDILPANTSGIIRVRKGVKPVDVSPVFGGSYYGLSRVDDASRYQLAIDPNNDGTILAVVADDPTTSTNYRLVLTTDARTNNPTWRTIENDTDYRGVLFASSDRAYLFGIDGAIGYIDNPQTSDTITSKTGNIDTETVGKFIGISSW